MEKANDAKLFIDANDAKIFVTDILKKVGADFNTRSRMSPDRVEFLYNWAKASPEDAKGLASSYRHTAKSSPDAVQQLFAVIIIGLAGNRSEVRDIHRPLMKSIATGDEKSPVTQAAKIFIERWDNPIPQPPERAPRAPATQAQAAPGG